MHCILAAAAGIERELSCSRASTEFIGYRPPVATQCQSPRQTRLSTPLTLGRDFYPTAGTLFRGLQAQLIATLISLLSTAKRIGFYFRVIALLPTPRAFSSTVTA